MYPVPDIDDVVAGAKALGIHLGPKEAALYRSTSWNCCKRSTLGRDTPGHACAPPRSPGCRGSYTG